MDLNGIRVVPYIYEMAETICAADILVCRSGATTVTEVAKHGKPAIFIPLPSMSANRQEDNALVLKKIGAAKIILNEKLTSENLASEINDIIYDEHELAEMGKIANTIAPSDVEEKIYQEIVELIKK